MSVYFKLFIYFRPTLATIQFIKSDFNFKPSPGTVLTNGNAMNIVIKAKLVENGFAPQGQFFILLELYPVTVFLYKVFLKRDFLYGFGKK